MGHEEDLSALMRLFLCVCVCVWWGACGGRRTEALRSSHTHTHTHTAFQNNWLTHSTTTLKNISVSAVKILKAQIKSVYSELTHSISK